jgi:hypothetical protein
LPQQPDVDDEMLDVIPATLATWAEWAGRRTGLPEEALAELRDFVDDVTAVSDEAEFDEADGLDSGVPPDDVYLVEVDPDDLGEDELADFVARRRFAFPSDSVRVGGEDFHELDPADPDERSLLIRGEHPSTTTRWTTRPRTWWTG